MTTGDRRTSFDAAYFSRHGVTKPPAAALAYARMMRDRLGSQARVLDAGCASGSVSMALREVADWLVVGVDVSFAPLAAIAGVSGTCATTYRLPLRTASIDGAFLLDVIEHLENPVAALVELRRVVRPRGTLVLSTPNAGSPLRPLLGRRWHGLADDTHLYFFTAFTLRHLLEKTGWQPHRTITTSSAPGLAGRLIARAGAGGELCLVATAAPLRTPCRPPAGG